MKATGILAACLFLATAVNVLPAEPRRIPYVIHVFRSAGTVSPLVQGRDGDFYGTTSSGGANGDGIVFRINHNGRFRTLVSFSEFKSGSWPRSGLILGRDGHFYGTTEIGGQSHSTTTFGTVFKMTPKGGLTTLTSFAGTNGYGPRARLVEGSDGNFYGTTLGGYYDSSDTNRRSGTVFRITPQGELTTLVWFNPQIGYGLFAGLVQGRDGNFYGTTFYGGSNDRGTVFKMTPNGQFSSLVSFDGANGDGPHAGLVQGSDGNFYGTTFFGGANDKGTIFRISASGELRTLVSFGEPEGTHPASELVEASDGSFYGTTAYGGDFNVGTVFRMNRTGESASLLFFKSRTSSPPVGRFPSSLVQGMDGRLYGTTSASFVDPATVYRFVEPSVQPIVPER